MAVYRRGYQRYQGELTGRWDRLLVLPRFAWQHLLKQRLIVIILVMAMFWPVGCALWVYLANHTALLQGFGGNLLDSFKITGYFFVIFMNVQATFAIVLSAFAGPSLIAPDLANGGLPLYFSRPMTRWEYALARMLVLAGILSPVTWIPGLILFILQSSMAGGNWFAQNWRLGAGILLGFLLWIVFVSLVAMASSAYVKWRIVAGALVIGVFFVLGGASTLANAVLRAEWALLLNPAWAMNQVWRAMLGAELLEGPGAFACIATMTSMAGILLLVLRRKLRPVEVVS